jgi:protein-tyrosine phosphatase
LDQGVRILMIATIEAIVAPWLPTWWLPVHVWATTVTAIVGVAVLLRYTSLLGKQTTGEIPWWSWFIWWPWHLAAHTSAWWFRGRGAPPFTEVHPGWWLGTWPHQAQSPEPWEAVLDLTCELPRRQQTQHYLCVPTWDMTQPSDDDLLTAVAFVLTQRDAGRPLLVHCAHGRGRSTMVVVAGLVAAGLHPTWQHALDHVRLQRPNVRLSSTQQRSLTEWQARTLPAAAEAT